MLECIKFGDCKVNMIQIGNEWFVIVCHISVALGVSSDSIKGILCNYLSPQYKFFRKEICIDISYEDFKLSTTIPAHWRVILSLTHLD